MLLQEFSGELIPKEVDLKWSPFWVQISNLPLKSRTRETDMEIGSKIGKVLDVDALRKVFNGDGTYGLESIWMLQRNLSEQRRFALRMKNQDGFSSNMKD